MGFGGAIVAAAAASSEPAPVACDWEPAKIVVGAEGGGSGAPPMTIMPNSTSFDGGPSERTSATVFFDGGIGFLLERIFILSSDTTGLPPRCMCIWVLRSDMSVDGARSVKVSVMAGLRADFRVRVMGCAAVSEPGGGAGAGPVLGGGGWGGEDSLGRVYGILVAKVFGSKTWSGWYFVDLLSTVVRKVFAN
jgi:hypothetical protein